MDRSTRRKASGEVRHRSSCRTIELSQGSLQNGSCFEWNGGKMGYHIVPFIVCWEVEEGGWGIGIQAYMQWVSYVHI